MKPLHYIKELNEAPEVMAFLSLCCLDLNFFGVFFFLWFCFVFLKALLGLAEGPF